MRRWEKAVKPHWSTQASLLGAPVRLFPRNWSFFSTNTRACAGPPPVVIDLLAPLVPPAHLVDKHREAPAEPVLNDA